jgi:hypothetical protein
VISVYQGKFFPFTYRAVGFLIPLAVAVKFITNTIHELSLAFYGLFLIVSAVLLFTEWTLELFPDKKIYRKSIRFFMIRIGWKKTFQNIEKIYINEVKAIYKAYIKFDDEAKIILDCDTDREALIKRLQEYNTSIQTVILDNSDLQNPRWVTA